MASRNRASAKKAGTRYENDVADYLRIVLDDPRIERRARHGAADTGDIAGLLIPEGPVVVECKNEADARPWLYLREAERERANANAALGVACMHVRRCGRAAAGLSLVAMERAAFNVYFEGEGKFPTDMGVFHPARMRDYALGTERSMPERFMQFRNQTDPKGLMVVMTLKAFAGEVAGGDVFLHTEEWNEICRYESGRSKKGR